MHRCEECGSPTPLGYCTRLGCSTETAGTAELHDALEELAERSRGGSEEVAKATAAIDLGGLFQGTERDAEAAICSGCGATMSTSKAVCTDCGSLVTGQDWDRPRMRLTLVHSASGFPGSSLALPSGRCLVGLDRDGLAWVTGQRSRALVEFEPAPGQGIGITNFPGFGVHLRAAETLLLQADTTLRVGQQVLVFCREPKGGFPRIGKPAREDAHTRLAAPGLKRAPWYMHRLLPNGSVGELIPLAGSMTVGSAPADVDLRDPYVPDVAFTLTADGPALELSVPQDNVNIWVRASAGSILQIGAEVWVGDGIYRVEAADD
jgi:hypothetical protein